MNKLLIGLLILMTMMFMVTCEDDPVEDTLKAPTDLVVASNTDSTVVLEWTDNSTAEVGFSITRSLTSDGTFTELTTVGEDVTTYTDTGLEEQTTYYYKVAAIGPGTDEFSAYTDYVAAVTGETAYASFDIETMMSVATADDANPEIIRMVPGSDNLAVFVASGTNQLFGINYTNTSFALEELATLSTGSATAEFTSIDVSPVIDGENYIAVCVAETDCARGSIKLVKLSDPTDVVTVPDIGYNPDGCAFTKDGQYLIVACEDDREDRECKPPDRHGGSVSIIDLTNGIANASLAQDYLVNHAEDSEPEHCETNADGDVIVSVQETSEVLIFNVADLPLEASDVTIVSLPNDAGDNEAEPDGLYISPDGTIALLSNERNGTLQMMDVATGSLYGDPHTIVNDLPSGWQYDARKDTKQTEPEECSLIEKTGKMYAVLALQESHAVIVYDVTDPENIIFDSISEAGIDWEADNEMEKSDIGSEGLAMHQTNGIAFSANEREGSITMFTAAWAR